MVRHDPARFAEFRRRYEAELAGQKEKLHELRDHARNGTLTLVYAARDTEHNDASCESRADALRATLLDASRPATCELN